MSRRKGSKNKPKTSLVNSNELFNIKEPEASIEPQVEEAEEIKKYKYSSFCELCNKEIYCSPVKLTLSIITGKSSYNRDCKKDILSVCDNCAKELSSLVDKFILDKNPSLRKYS